MNKKLEAVKRAYKDNKQLKIGTVLLILLLSLQKIFVLHLA